MRMDVAVVLAEGEGWMEDRFGGEVMKRRRRGGRGGGYSIPTGIYTKDGQ